MMDLSGYLSRRSAPFLIAEAGVNHEGSLAKALRLVKLAAQGKVDAIKFQTYKAERLAARTSRAYWDRSEEPARSQFELFKRYDAFSPDEYRKLAEACARQRLVFLSTPFDLECIDWLDPLVPCHKIASADITNFPLMGRVAQTRKPVFLSTGASTLGEIRSALQFLRRNGAPQVVLLHCVLSYPTRPRDANVAALADMRRAFPSAALGYSDHTKPEDSFAAIGAAYVLGARVIEKHFTFEKSLPGNDHYHAFDAADFRKLRAELDHLAVLLGEGQKRVFVCEELSRKHARRSLVAAKPIPKGSRIKRAMIDFKRPGTGINTRQLGEVIGRVAKINIAQDTILRWFMLEHSR